MHLKIKIILLKKIYAFSQHGLVIYWQAISRHQLLINASIITNTGIDVNKSKGETLLGYLTAIWPAIRFNSMLVCGIIILATDYNLKQFWHIFKGVLMLSDIYLIAISQEATINYNMCSCSWLSFSGPKKLKIVQIIGNWKPCKVCRRFHQPILTGEMWRGHYSKLAGG